MEGGKNTPVACCKGVHVAEVSLQCDVLLSMCVHAGTSADASAVATLALLSQGTQGAQIDETAAVLALAVAASNGSLESVIQMLSTGAAGAAEPDPEPQPDVGAAYLAIVAATLASSLETNTAGGAQTDTDEVLTAIRVAALCAGAEPRDVADHLNGLTAINLLALAENGKLDPVRVALSYNPGVCACVCVCVCVCVFAWHAQHARHGAHVHRLHCTEHRHLVS